MRAGGLIGSMGSLRLMGKMGNASLDGEDRSALSILIGELV